MPRRNGKRPAAFLSLTSASIDMPYISVHCCKPFGKGTLRQDTVLPSSKRSYSCRTIMKGIAKVVGGIGTLLDPPHKREHSPSRVRPYYLVTQSRLGMQSRISSSSAEEIPPRRGSHRVVKTGFPIIIIYFFVSGCCQSWHDRPVPSESHGGGRRTDDR